MTKNDKKTIFGWCMYDWANSAYITTVVAALLPNYFALVIVGEKGVQIGNTVVSASVLWGAMISVAAFFVFLFAPVLGAISDFSSTKKKFLMSFAYTGSISAMVLYFCGSGDVWMTVIFFLISRIGFVGANVFYDGFLPQIASEDKMDWVSGKGYSYGYVGGGLQFAIALGLVAGHEALGISQSLAARIGIGMAGLWWAGFTLFAIAHLKEGGASESIRERYQATPKLFAYIGIGVTRTLGTLRKIQRFKHLLLFLIAFMIYNDGIQTVISMAAIYGTEELKFSTTVLMVTLLIIQIIASGGALLFGVLAGKIGTKPAVMLSLVLWSFVITYAYFLQTATEFLILGAVVGIVLGGSQALSRSLYGSMIPEESSAEFYGFYSVFSKFSAIWGPLVFSVIRQITGTARLSIISLIIFFIVGLILLWFVDVEKAQAAKRSGVF